jgi:hypothetical protein
MEMIARAVIFRDGEVLGMEYRLSYSDHVIVHL